MPDLHPLQVGVNRNNSLQAMRACIAAQLSTCFLKNLAERANERSLDVGSPGSNIDDYKFETHAVERLRGHKYSPNPL